MDWKKLFDYTSFTRKERLGIIAASILVLLLVILPHYIYQYLRPTPTVVSAEIQQTIDSIKIVIDSNQLFKNQRRENNFNDPRFRDFSPHIKNNHKNIKGELFYFDPNTLSKEGWIKLGVSEKAADNIIKYRDHGGYFKLPDDLDKIYSLNDDMVDRLMPYIVIKQRENSFENKSLNATNVSLNTNDELAGNSTGSSRVQKTTAIIDINTADTTAFKSLSGIGSKLSARIVNFREKLGGFINVDQLGETFGLPDSTFQKIKPQLVCKPNQIKKININTATVEQLKHPYLKWHQAKNIVEYRNQHGLYKSLSQLRNLATINEAELAKILPYLTVE